MLTSQESVLALITQSRVLRIPTLKKNQRKGMTGTSIFYFCLIILQKPFLQGYRARNYLKVIEQDIV